MSADRWRRPSPTWCTDAAVRMLQVGCRDADVLVDGERLLEPGDAELLVRAAAILDAYGQRLESAKVGRSPSS